MTLCSSVGEYQRFRGKCFLHLQGGRVDICILILMHPFVHPINQSVNYSFIHSFIQSTSQSITHSSINSSNQPVNQLLIHTFLHPVNQSINYSFIHSFIQSISQSITHSSIHPINQSINYSFIQSTSQSITHSSNQPVNQLLIHSFIHPINQSINYSFIHSLIQSTSQSITHSFIHSSILPPNHRRIIHCVMGSFHPKFLHMSLSPVYSSATLRLVIFHLTPSTRLSLALTFLRVRPGSHSTILCGNPFPGIPFTSPNHSNRFPSVTSNIFFTTSTVATAV